MPPNRPAKEIQTEREFRAWELRQRGYTQAQIAGQLKVDQGTVSRMLERVNRRELKRLSKQVEQLKVDQQAQHEWIVSESLRAWERSLREISQAISKTTRAPDREGNIVEATTEQTSISEQTGNVAYLQTAMDALRSIRHIWGVELAGDQGSGASSAADLARQLAERAKAYEARRAEQAKGHSPEPGSTPDGGAPGVPNGPEPVQ